MKTVWSFFQPTDVEEVPELPGLYAWYLNFVNTQGFPDPVNFLAKYHSYLRAFVSDTEDDQKDHLGKSYLAHLVGSGRFGDEYTARLRVTNKLVEKDAKKNRVMPSHDSNVGAQEILRTLFNDGFQILSSPIYVGKSENLKRRVEEHLTAIDDAKEVAGRFGDDWFVANDPPKTFARRLVGLGLDASVLLFATVTINPSEHNMTLTDAMYWIEEAEYYFNNICRPSLGRK